MSTHNNNKKDVQNINNTTSLAPGVPLASIDFDELAQLNENLAPLAAGRSVEQYRKILAIHNATSDPSVANNAAAQNKRNEFGLMVDPYATAGQKHDGNEDSIKGSYQQRNLKQLIEDCRDEHVAQLEAAVPGTTDVLGIWASYIENITTLTYSSSITALVLPIIECCINQICTDRTYLTQYAQDPRLFKYFNLLCDAVQDPLRIFRFMAGKGISQQNAKFYLNYSTALYTRGYYRNAMEILYSGIKNKAEPVLHVKNRYKYIIQCEKQRLTKMLGVEVDDKRLQEIVKAKTHNNNPLIGANGEHITQPMGQDGYSFTYQETTDNILGNNNGNHDNNNDGDLNNNALLPTTASGSGLLYDADGNLIRRGLHVLYKPEYKGINTLATDYLNRNSQNRKSVNNSVKVRPIALINEDGTPATTTTSAGLPNGNSNGSSDGGSGRTRGIGIQGLPKGNSSSGIYCDSDEEEQDTTTKSKPTAKRGGGGAARKQPIGDNVMMQQLGTAHGSNKENWGVHTGDFENVYDPQYLDKLHDYNTRHNIVPQNADRVLAALPDAKLTTGIYCDDSD